MYKFKKFRDSIKKKSATKKHFDLMIARNCFYRKVCNIDGLFVTSIRIDFNQYHEMKELIRNGSVHFSWLKNELEYYKVCPTFRDEFLRD